MKWNHYHQYHTSKAETLPHQDPLSAGCWYFHVVLIRSLAFCWLHRATSWKSVKVFCIDWSSLRYEALIYDGYPYNRVWREAYFNSWDGNENFCLSISCSRHEREFLSLNLVLRDENENRDWDNSRENFLRITFLACLLIFSKNGC